MTLKSLVYVNQRSQFTHWASASAVFCLCIQNSGAMCEKSGIFNSNSVPTYRTRTITKKAYRTSVPYLYHCKTGVPYFLAKIEAYRTQRTVLPSLVARTGRNFKAVQTKKKVKILWSTPSFIVFSQLIETFFAFTIIYRYSPPFHHVSQLPMLQIICTRFLVHK